MKPLKRLLIAGVFIIILIVVGMGAAVYFTFLVPTGKIKEPVILKIEHGDTLSDTAEALKELEAIRDDTVFILAARVLGVERSIREGEYEITPEMTPKEILLEILKGRVIEYPVTIPEGFNIYEIARLLDEKGFVNEETFLELSEDKEYITYLGVDANTLEGYLFPDTYNLNVGMTEQDIIWLMVRRFWDVFKKEKEKGVVVDEGSDIDTGEIGDTGDIGDTGFSDYEVLIIASIVEKEASAPEERPLVSAVFVNRLGIYMKLDSCATVIYGIRDRFDGNLTRNDLKSNTPYNTYLKGGLPPTPICNPGRAAISAALYPADVDYLYFVSKNNGTHYFSKTLSEHNRAVYEYQKLRKYR